MTGERGLRLLLVGRREDSDHALWELEHEGLRVDATQVAALDALAPTTRREQPSFDVVILALRTEDTRGLEALSGLRRLGIEAPVIVVTDALEEDAGVDALRAGAFDYVLRERLARLPLTVRMALTEHRRTEDQSRAEARLRAYARQHAAVAQLGQEALSGAPMETLMDAAVRLVARGLGAERVEVLELLPDGEEMLVRAGVGWSYDAIGTARLPATAETMSGFVLRRRESVVSEDVHAERRFAPDPSAEPDALRSAAGVVIAGQGGPFGVLSAHARQAGSFTPDGVHFLESVANLLAEAISRRQAGETLRLLESAVRQATDAIMISTAELAGDGPAIVYVNPAFSRITGYTASEILGRPGSLLNGPHTDPGTLERLGIHLRQGRAFSGELIQRRKDGTEFRAEVHVAPVRSEDGEITHFVTTQRDVSQRAQLEEQLRQSQKIEAVGRLAGGVAHDFNNILMAITGYATFLLESMDPDHEFRMDIEEIERAANRGAALTHQLLAFSRRQVLQPRVLDLNEIVVDLERMLRRLIGEDIELVTVLDAELGTMKADPGQIQQVLLNLILNARDAMPDGGRLTIETAALTLTESYAHEHVSFIPGDYVRLVVSDNGTGMDSYAKAHLFEPFFTTKEKGKGTGLGLATVYGIVKQSGGYVYVYSELGHGTTFKLYFPRLPMAAGAAPAPTLPRPGPGTETLLLAEDEESVRTLTRRILESHGYTVLDAQNGLEAMEVARRYDRPIDLLVTDVIMPGMSGPKLAEEIRAARPEIKVLYMSGYTENALAPRGGLDPRTAFLQKPFSPIALAAKIREVLDHAGGEE